MTSHTVVDVNASIHTIHVKTNLSTGSTIDSLTGAVTDTLAIVPVQVNPGTTIFHNPTNAIKTSPIHASHINQVSVNLVDNKGRALDLNGLSFGVGLLLYSLVFYVCCSTDNPFRNDGIDWVRHLRFTVFLLFVLVSRFRFRFMV